MSDPTLELHEEINEAEWEAAFPFEQEYNAWLNSIEEDFIDECAHRAGIISREDRDGFSFD